jgi:hypothetical protein
LGYAPPGNGTAALFAVDVTATNNAKVQNNTICQATPQLTVGIANAIAAALTHAAKAAGSVGDPGLSSPNQPPR